MKLGPFPLIVLLGLLFSSGCQQAIRGIQHIERKSYDRGSPLPDRTDSGFIFRAPDSWGFWSAERIPGSVAKRGVTLGISYYDYSPAIQLDYLGADQSVESDLSFFRAFLTKLERVPHSYPLRRVTEFCGLSGRGEQQMLKTANHVFEVTVFYPEGSLRG